MRLTATRAPLGWSLVCLPNAERTVATVSCMDAYAGLRHDLMDLVHSGGSSGSNYKQFCSRLPRLSHRRRGPLFSRSTPLEGASGLPGTLAVGPLRSGGLPFNQAAAAKPLAPSGRDSGSRRPPLRPAQLTLRCCQPLRVRKEETQE